MKMTLKKKMEIKNYANREMSYNTVDVSAI